MVYNLHGPFDKLRDRMEMLRDRMGCFAIWYGPFISLASISRLVGSSIVTIFR